MPAKATNKPACKPGTKPVARASRPTVKAELARPAPFKPGDLVQRRGSFGRGTVMASESQPPFRVAVDMGDAVVLFLPARQFSLVTEQR